MEKHRKETYGNIVKSYNIYAIDALWAAIYGVTQSRTRMKRLSSSNSSSNGVWGGREISAPTGKNIIHVWAGEKKKQHF